MADHLLLSEAETLEIVAYLVTAARLLHDEPVDYGPMRLVSTAQRICEFAGPRASPPVRQLFGELAAEVTPQIRQRVSNRAAYLEFLDRRSRDLARTLAHDAGREV